MLAVIGTVPVEDFPLLEGPALLEGEELLVGGHRVPVRRGTPALAAAALCAREVLGIGGIYVFLVGDIGLGRGSRRLYEHLTQALPGASFGTLTFHYLQPDVDWHNRVLFAVQAMQRRPLLIADAGFMYAAKMSGEAPSYDLFTPDAGEIAFLADEQAPHPFYTRGFILHEEALVPDLITRAYLHRNASRLLLVKGKTDYVADENGILETVCTPVVATLEPIGGTGDTLTGIVSALAASGRPLPEAAAMGARINRVAGALADPTPATQVGEIIGRIPEALRQVLGEARGRG